MNRYTTPTFLVATLLSVLCTNGAVADDTEVYLDQISLPPEQIRPNVVFILDSSGSMGLPLNRNARFLETSTYNHSTTYEGSVNTNGGAGDSNYYYLYRKSSNSAEQYIYYNKVHTSQMTCNMSTLNDSTPYTTNSDRFIYNDGTSNWGHMCDENNTSCNFTPAANGALVDCKSEENHITQNSAYPSQRLFVVNHNFHNFLQGFYRYSVLQTVVKDLIDTPFDINLGLMKFNGGNGGVVIKEAVDANLASNREELKSVVNSIEARGVTPLVESLWEAARYMRGETATYGYDLPGVNAFASGTTYDSPIDYACQKNHIILLTDGNPYYDEGRDAAIRSLTGSSCEHSNNANAADESCLDDFAGWLHYNDSERRDHSTGANGLTGTQAITVHTIGFGLDNPLLEATAHAGSDLPEPGLSKVASTASELADAFSTILDQTDFEKGTFVAPAVAVNAYNGLQHRDEVYFALFQPNSSPRWYGNIKKYKLDGEVLRDQRNNAAIDSDTGFFRNSSPPDGKLYNALSYWTEVIDFDNDDDIDGNDGDGSRVNAGGSASKLDDPSARKIYTYTSAGSPNNQALVEELAVDNTRITAAMLGVDSADERSDVINWARGGVTGGTPAPNYFIADLIHSRPSVVTYVTDKSTDAQGNVSVSFEDTIFAASNMGFFHAIDADTGDEIFSFVPEELFPNLTTYYEDSGGFTDKVYGLDAPMTVWRHDDNSNGSIVSATGTPEANDHVYIYQAMRRGGSSIYALDVTRLSSPRFMWQIDGTAYDASPSGDFANLAQTWSVPQRGKIQWGCNSGGGGCTEKDVLFFAGGYDTAYDEETVSTTSTNKGNAIYMVDALTGDLLWSAGRTSHSLNLAGMTNSIPADVTVGDVDSDGYVDFLFAVDIRGGLWRFDFSDEPSSAANFATGGKIAQLGETTGATFRHFYNAPDVAYFARRGNPPFLTISVSSGYRAHPRNGDVRDSLFVVFDQNAIGAPSGNNYSYADSGSSVIDDSDLGIGTASTHGWQLAFENNGEKGLSRTITFGDRIIMTTYVPSNTATCTGSIGEGRYYLLDALNGTNLTVNPDTGNSVPYNRLKHGGIPPEPAVIYTTEDVCVSNCNDGNDSNDETEERTDLIVCIGTECVDDVVDQTLHKTFWRENNAN